MELTAKLVMSLRDKTLLPMMKCKEALLATQGPDTEEQWLKDATEWFRKQGMNLIGKKDREITNGGIGLAITKNNTVGSIVHLGCQTDFVSNTSNFKDLAQTLAIANSAFDVDLMNDELKVNDVPISELLTTASAQLGETIKVVATKKVTGDVVVGYNHGRIAALVAGSGDETKLRNVALHIVAANPAPIALNKESVDPQVIAKEKEILLSLSEVQSKPEAMREKIVLGKLGRFFKEKTLLEQEMLVDGEKKQTVADYCSKNGLVVTDFYRLDINNS